MDRRNILSNESDDMVQFLCGVEVHVEIKNTMRESGLGNQPAPIEKGAVTNWTRRARRWLCQEDVLCLSVGSRSLVDSSQGTAPSAEKGLELEIIVRFRPASTK